MDDGWAEGILDGEPPGFLKQSYGEVSPDSIGHDDEVRLEHAVTMYRSLPDAELAVVPGTSHGLLVEKPALCNLLITEFLTKDPGRPWRTRRVQADLRATGARPER